MLCVIQEILDHSINTPISKNFYNNAKKKKTFNIIGNIFYHYYLQTCSYLHFFRYLDDRYSKIYIKKFTSKKTTLFMG